MSPDEGGLAALDFPHAAAPPAGTVQEIAPGVRWLRMPLPFALNHINLWLVEDGTGHAIIDTGINDDTTKGLWRQIFAKEIAGKPITRVICTHYHPDHMGLAGWLTETLGVELWATDTEWRFGYERSRVGQDGVHPLMLDLYRHAGLPDAPKTGGVLRGSHYRTRVSPVPEHHVTLSDGMAFIIGGRTWRVVVGRGHAPEHACLHCPELDLLIAGDQVLPKISPNVSLWPMDLDPDPLGSFLASLDKLRHNVSATSFVLPSHNLPFYGLHTRLDQLRALHEQRLLELEVACEKPRSTAELVPLLFTRELDGHQLGFAVGETLAHLQHATIRGLLVRTDGPEDVWLYRRA
ncbi:MAG TPA: MBL fold metallo-hydrolase [Stellaceae bacterium]|nr:MBL fold metallo-hydrolase [Stellaceae bacterium]